MQVNNQKIVVLGTGGTIAGESASETESLNYQAAQRSIADLLKPISGQTMQGPASIQPFAIEAVQVAQIDSKDMDFEVWRRLAVCCSDHLSRDEVKAVVITHGTDTLEETAYFLSQVIHIDKPIVLTCAMRPANFKDADGPQNLRDALNFAAQARGRGVWLVAAGEIHHSQYVQKVHPTRLNAFDSGEWGAAASVHEDQIKWLKSFEKNKPQSGSDGILKAIDLPEVAQWPWVEIVTHHVQSNGRALSLLVKAGVHGVVVAGTGNGSVSASLKDALLSAQSHGVQVCVASRCNQGPVLPTENHVFKTAGELNAVKTRVALILDLMSKQKKSEADLFESGSPFSI